MSLIDLNMLAAMKERRERPLAPSLPVSALAAPTASILAASLLPPSSSSASPSSARTPFPVPVQMPRKAKAGKGKPSQVQGPTDEQAVIWTRFGKSFMQATKNIDMVLQEARQGPMRRRVAGTLLETGYDLHAMATGLHYDGVTGAGSVTRVKTEEVLDTIWKLLEQTAEDEADARADERVALEREQVTAGLDAAQADATAARRDLDAAQRRHAEREAAWDAERRTLEQSLNKVRYDADKRIERLEADVRDLPRLQRLVAEQDVQLRQVRAEREAFIRRERELLDRIEALSRPENLPILAPAPAPDARPPVTALERASYVNHCRAQTGELDRKDFPQTPELLAGWRSACPTESAMQEQVLEAVRSRRARSAA